MEFDEDLEETDIKLRVTKFPNGTRDFLFLKTAENGDLIPLNPIELLVLDRGNELIKKEIESNEPKAMNLALCRLLAPNLKTKRVGRHLVVEEWTEEKAKGVTLPDEVNLGLSVELSKAQADKWKMVQSGTEVPSDILQNLFWKTTTQLPLLPSQFDDQNLGKFGKRLYFYLIPEGDGDYEIPSWRDLAKKVEELRKNDFVELDMGLEPKKIQKLFRLYMSVVLRWTSKMTGQIATELASDLYKEDLKLNSTELLIFQLRYGATECFGKINVGYLLSCGPLFADFFNEIIRSLAVNGNSDHQHSTFDKLFKFVYLQQHYLELRRYAWQEEKNLNAEKRRKSLGENRIPESELIDTSIDLVEKNEVIQEEMLFLTEKILPALEKTKPKQAYLLRCLMDEDGDKQSAASAANMELKKYKRQLRETILKSVHELAKKLKNGE